MQQVICVCACHCLRYPGVRSFHWVVRGFIVRQHVLRVLASAATLHRCARRFLRRNRLYRIRIGAVVKVQAAWRGFVFRVVNEDMMDVSEIVWWLHRFTAHTDSPA